MMYRSGGKKMEPPKQTLEKLVLVNLFKNFPLLKDKHTLKV